MRKQQHGLRMLLVFVLLIPAMLIQTSVDKQRLALGFSKKGTEGGWKLPIDMFIASLVGFREPIAGLLWVKCDDYFHSGKFEEVVPLMRVVTKLDPKMVDVYATGSWHLDYNFVDKNERSDRRLIPSAIEFLEEGVENNQTIFDLYFEMAFTHNMVKIKDPEAAIRWLKRARGKRTSDKGPTPRYVYHTLAHAYEQAGDINNSLKTWQECINHAKSELQRIREHSKSVPKQTLDPLKANSPEEIAAWDLDVSTRNYDRMKTRLILRENLAQRQIDTQLEYSVKKVKSRLLQIKGQIRVADYGRVDVILRDVDWRERAKKDFGWRLDNQTIFMESVPVNGGKFSCNIDLTDGERFYPLKSGRYELIVELNPRFEATEVQDQIGWSGEGLTDKKYLIIIPGDPKRGIPPLRIVRKRIVLPLSEIM